jgi:hypothetical protein
MASVNGNDLVLAIRMRELCRPPTAWNRCLWQVSTQTVLREVIEAARIRRDGILSDASVCDLQAAAGVSVGRDLGVGDARARKYLQQFLTGKSVVTPGSLAAASIETAIADLDAEYLNRWAVVADRGVTDELLEQCARCVVSHLLNNGHSAAVIADAIEHAVLSPGSVIATGGDLIRELTALTRAAPVVVKAVFPVSAAPLSSKTSSPGWMSGRAVGDWLRQNPAVRPRPGDRYIGAVTMDITARDHLAAAEKATSQFAIILNRAILGSRRPIETLGYFWLSGHTNRYSIDPTTRGVEVASIGRQDRVYTTDPERDSIDRGIALLAELNHGPASAAVTSGWAALESLAMGPAEDGNRIETAIRAASLVTASFPRAELTTLAYSYWSSNRDQLAIDLRAAATNRERAAMMMQRLQAAPLPAFGRVEDAAAAKRMQQLMADPAQVMKRINQYIENALKRLYRLRNLVAHGGRTDSIVLDAGVRVAAPLVGCAFDRIHHASVSQRLRPVELIARAQWRTYLLDPGQLPLLVELLE